MNAEEVGKLISSGSIRDAGERLRDMIYENPENDKLWYLKGIVSLKARNYEGAISSFTKAHMIDKKPEYFRMKGIAHLEVFELDEAIECFEDALECGPDDVHSLFYISICYMFFDNPLAMGYIKKAYEKDREKTKQLLNNFYSTFFSGSSLDLETKSKIRQSLKNL